MRPAWSVARVAVTDRSKPPPLPGSSTESAFAMCGLRRLQIAPPGCAHSNQTGYRSGKTPGHLLQVLCRAQNAPWPGFCVEWPVQARCPIVPRGKLPMGEQVKLIHAQPLVACPCSSPPPSLTMKPTGHCFRWSRLLLASFFSLAYLHRVRATLTGSAGLIAAFPAAQATRRQGPAPAALCHRIGI